LQESLGAKLKAAREAKGLTIDQLSAITKISPAFLNAMEDGRWDLLPGRVYLKPFTKLCAEALDLNVKELYEKIDGGLPEDRRKYELPPSDPTPVAPPPKRVDYKLPIVAISVLIVILLISFAVKTRQFGVGGSQRDVIVPAGAQVKKEEIKWDRPWERPSSVRYSQNQRLRLETTDEVWVCVVADQDTIFQGIMPPNSGKTFIADSGFRLSLGRNDCVTAYLNGAKVKGVGISPRTLGNFQITPIKEETNSPDEAK
jgi:transcriptional regulator with XRE-family HTH domain